ncbi:metal-dependent phosphohydrolase [Spirochaetia bacterium]|nr:metal-dependent phosphohydrolase [Spirochaetia bacterium]
MKIDVSSLRADQKYTKALFLDDGTMFLPENIALRQKDITLLTTLDVKSLSTDGVLIGGELPVKKNKSIATILANTLPVKTQINKKGKTSEVNKKIEVLIKQLDTIFEFIKAKKPVNIRSLWQITATLIHIIKTDRMSSIAFILGSTISGYEMAKSSINIAILSAVIGMEMKFDTQKVLEIVAGAMLHDVGMLRVPPEIINKKGALSPNEAQIIASHPYSSYSILVNELLYPKTVGLIALQHHERWDGTGYPQRLQGNSIDSGALVVSIADAFEAMVSEKPYRNSLTGYQAMKNLVSENAVCFSPDMIKTFVNIMGIYPIGSSVVLNDGSVAKVLDTNSEIPLRPVVQIVIDKDGKELFEVEIINLLANKNMFIARAL